MIRDFFFFFASRNSKNDLVSYIAEQLITVLLYTTLFFSSRQQCFISVTKYPFNFVEVTLDSRNGPLTFELSPLFRENIILIRQTLISLHTSLIFINIKTNFHSRYTRLSHPNRLSVLGFHRPKN